MSHLGCFLASKTQKCLTPFLIPMSWAWSYQQKKSEKFPEFGSDFWILEIEILPKIFGYYFQKSGQLAAPKNQIWFFQIFPKKFEGSKFSDLSGKKNWILEFLLVGSSPDEYFFVGVSWADADGRVLEALLVGGRELDWGGHNCPNLCPSLSQFFWGRTRRGQRGRAEKTLGNSKKLACFLSKSEI